MKSSRSIGVVGSVLVGLGALAIGCGGSKQSYPAADASAADAPPPPADSAPPPDAGPDAFLATANCPVQTGHAGDELALCVPPRDLGFQLHYGPKDYSNQAEVESFMLGPGEEAEDCIYVKSPNRQTVYFREFHGRMRPGSHHMIVWGLDQDVPDGRGPCERGINRFFAASQMPVFDVPAPGEENLSAMTGLAYKLEPQTQLAIDLHELNSTPTPQLREAWLNFVYKDPNDVVTLLDTIFFVDVGIDVPPHSRDIEHSGCANNTGTTINIGLLTGHFHKRGVRFSAWKTDAMGGKTLVYETYDWNEPGVLNFDMFHMNPAADPTNKIMGGWSGPLVLDPGEGLAWECEFVNDSAQRFSFGDSAKTDEMCNLFGYYYPTTGATWNCPTFEPGVSTPLP
jgi:hypothetical protein